MYDDYEFDGKESGSSTIVGVMILCALIIGGALGLIWYLQGAFVGRQFITALLSPVGLLWILLFINAMVATFTKQKFLAAALWLTLLALNLLGNASVASNLIGGLEDSQKNVTLADEAEFDYAFVLGGGANLVRGNHLDFNDGGERVMDAIQLYKRAKIKHLVFTGCPFLYFEDEAKAKLSDNAAEPTPVPANNDPKADNPAGATDPAATTDPAAAVPDSLNSDADSGDPLLPTSGPSAWQDETEPSATDPNAKSTAEEATPMTAYEEALRKFLNSYGVADSDYTFIGGRNTVEEMLRIDEFLKEKLNTKNALITSAWHMPRASRLAIRQALELQSIPVDFRAEASGEDPIFFIPKANALYTSSVAIKEYLASWVQ